MGPVRPGRLYLIGGGSVEAEGLGEGDSTSLDIVGVLSTGCTEENCVYSTIVPVTLGVPITIQMSAYAEGTCLSSGACNGGGAGEGAQIEITDANFVSQTILE